MATPMTPDQIFAAFRREGLTVVEVPGWRTNDRGPATGRPTGPKYGLVNHHTGGDTSNPYAYAAGLLFKGSSTLVGPLCHQGLDPDTGTLYMVGTGRTNHAGGGDPAVLAAVKADAVPYDRELKPTKGNADGVDGNAPFYGLEVMYSGARDVPRVGYVAMVKWNTAICRFHGWSGASAIGHREWSNDKPDPGRINLPQLRRDVDAALAMPAGAWGTSTPPPPKDDDMQADERQALFEIRDRLRGNTADGTDNIQDLLMGLDASNRQLTNLAGRADLDPDAIASAVVDHMGADFAAKVVDALGARINAGTAPDPTASRSLDTLLDDAAPDCAEPSKHNV